MNSDLIKPKTTAENHQWLSKILLTLEKIDIKIISIQKMIKK
jgi:hypothetical protein